MNAAPYFYKQDANIPANEDVPELHRYTAGGALGGALIKDKLFGYIAYQHTHASDLEIGTSRTAVPFGLADDRSAATLAAVDNQNFRTARSIVTCGAEPPPNPTPCLTAGGVDAVAFNC